MELRKAVDNLCIYDPEFEAYAKKFADEMGGSTEIFAVKTIDDLKAAVAGFVQVRFLEVVLHGAAPGLLKIADGNFVRGGFFGTLSQNTPFLQKNARILFSSCGVGAGHAGSLFMDDLGKSMFRGKGGTVGAATVENMVILPNSRIFTQAFLKPFSDGRLRVRRYDADGNRTAELSVNRWGFPE